MVDNLTGLAVGFLIAGIVGVVLSAGGAGLMADQARKRAELVGRCVPLPE